MKPDLNYSVDALERLTHFSVLVIEGPDAENFVQAQSMNDVKSLASGYWHWNGLLNPKGRLIALFALVRMEEGKLLLLSPDFPATALLQHLQRFVFRSKVKLSVSEHLHAYAGDHAAIGWHGQKDLIIGNAESGFALDMSGDTEQRCLLLLPVMHSVNRLADAQWREADLRHGLPRLTEAQREMWTPQMLSLERLRAFSVKKGCYPGQEIVARTHFLGQSKRFLACLEAVDALLQLDQSILQAEQTIGQVICISESKKVGLAVMTKPVPAGERLNVGLNVPFLSGLQRPT
jgi:tRNA-modifying protein YgfZ